MGSSNYFQTDFTIYYIWNDTKDTSSSSSSFDPDNICGGDTKQIQVMHGAI